jgi:hypothetical protein
MKLVLVLELLAAVLAIVLIAAAVGPEVALTIEHSALVADCGGSDC